VSGRTAWSLPGLSRSFRGVPLDELPAEIRRALLAAGKVERQPDGTLVALSRDAGDPGMLAYGDELGLALELANDALAGGYPEDEDEECWAGQDEDPGAAQLAGGLDPQGMALAAAEAEFALAAGAAEDLGSGQLADAAEIGLAGEVERLSQHHAELQLRDAGHRLVRPRSVAGQLDERRVSPDEAGLAMSDLGGAIEELAGFNGNVIPEHGTTWYDPQKDGPGNDGQGGSSVLGDRAQALAGLTRAVADPGGWAVRNEAEVIGLSYRGDGESGLSDSLPAGWHAHAHSHDGSAHSHPHAHTDGTHRHPHPGDGSAAAEVNRILGHATALGLESATQLKVSSRWHGKAGTQVTSSQRAHHSDLERDGRSDTRQPRRGGRPYPGVRGGIYDTGGPGGPEEIRSPHTGLTATGQDEYWHCGSPAEIWARHAGQL
jgi:hypothetical protein